MLAVAIVCCLAGAFVLRNAGIDDVGISYRYARNLGDGAGLTWNVGEEPVEGYSNLLWVLILALGHVFGADIQTFARVLGLLLGLATLYQTYRLASAIQPDTSSALPGMVPLLVALTPAWLMWVMSGLELALYSFLLVTALLALTMHGPRRTVLMTISLSALVLTRPEGIGLALCYLVMAWIQRDKSMTGLTGGLAIPLIAVAATVIGVTSFRLAYYGFPLPNTVYAKFSTLFPSAEQVGLWLLYALPFLLIWGVTARSWWHSLARVVMFTAIALVLTQTLQVLPVNPVMHFLHRYTIAFVPLLYLVTPTLLSRLARRAKMLAWMGTAILSVWVLQDWPAVLRFYDAYQFTVERQACVIEKLSTLPGTPRIAMIDAGLIPFRTQLPAIDIGGLCDRVIGHEGFSVSRVLEHHEGPPDVVIMALFPVLDKHISPFGQDRKILADSSFQAHYGAWYVCDADSTQRPPNTNRYWYLDYGIYLRPEYMLNR